MAGPQKNGLLGEISGLLTLQHKQSLLSDCLQRTSPTNSAERLLNELITLYDEALQRHGPWVFSPLRLLCFDSFLFKRMTCLGHRPNLLIQQYSQSIY